MALIKCAECGKEISDSAEVCPNCGCKTSRGETVSQAKGLAVNYVIVAALIIIGLILFFPAMSELGDVSSYLWNSGYWVHYEEIVGALFRFAIGIGMFLGGVIDMLRIAKKAKNLNNPKENDASNVVPAEMIFETELGDIPAEKWIHGRCQMCNSQGRVAVCRIPNLQFDYELCPNCIKKYHASAK